MLGLNGLVVKTHGSSNAKEICNSVIQCFTYKEQNIQEKFKKLYEQPEAPKTEEAPAEEAAAEAEEIPEENVSEEITETADAEE